MSVAWDAYYSGRPKVRWPLVAVLVIALLLGGEFIYRVVLPYLSLNPARFGHLWLRRYSLWAHLAGGSIALLLAPVQLWSGETGYFMPLHRSMGKLYLWAVALSCLIGYYLAIWALAGDRVYAAGLLGLAIAWTVTTGLAYLAIGWNLIDQHREWMIRSSVVTFAFVFLHLIVRIAHWSGHTSGKEYRAAAWLCWTVPLLVTETGLQWHRFWSRRYGGRR